MTDQDNYDYYMNEVENQKFEWPKSYADTDPDEAQSFIEEDAWQERASSEWSSYQNDIDMVDSYE